MTSLTNEIINFSTFFTSSRETLISLAEDHGFEIGPRKSRSEIAFYLAEQFCDSDNFIVKCSGCLELVQKEKNLGNQSKNNNENSRLGYLRFKHNSYNDYKRDPEMSISTIEKYDLRQGDLISATLNFDSDTKKFILVDLESVNHIPIGDLDLDRKHFKELESIYPDEQIKLELASLEEEASRKDKEAKERGEQARLLRKKDKVKNKEKCEMLEKEKIRLSIESQDLRNKNMIGRLMDIFTPIGRGQRALLVSPPKSGKTTILKHIANVISEKYPEIELFMLLVDERPEEVSDMEASVGKDKVFASTFSDDRKPQVKIAEMVIARAERLVELGKDVVILFDSITRFSRATQAYKRITGETSREPAGSGGLSQEGVKASKQLYGSARNIKGEGSLTIIATALIGTHSRMDSAILEEFKGTGNSEILLDRRVSECRVFPALNLDGSSTRNEERLLDEQVLKKTYDYRYKFRNRDPVRFVEWMKERLSVDGCRSNDVYFAEHAEGDTEVDIEFSWQEKVQISHVNRWSGT